MNTTEPAIPRPSSTVVVVRAAAAKPDIVKTSLEAYKELKPVFTWLKALSERAD